MNWHLATPEHVFMCKMSFSLFFSGGQPSFEFKCRKVQRYLAKDLHNFAAAL